MSSSIIASVASLPALLKAVVSSFAVKVKEVDGETFAGGLDEAEESCFLGALPPVFLRAVCLVRAISEVVLLLKVARST